MSFFGTLVGELGKVAITGLNAASQAQATKAQAKHDRKYGVSAAPAGKKQAAGTTCTPCAARARVEAAKAAARKAP